MTSRERGAMVLINFAVFCSLAFGGSFILLVLAAAKMGGVE